MVTTSQACCCQNGAVDIPDTCDPGNTTDVIRLYPYWKQMYISECLVIPEAKPDAERINSVTTSAIILKKKVIKTPRTFDDSGAEPVAEPNIEGRLLTGRKLIIEGQLCQQVEYTATDAPQPVHSVEFYVPFSSYIVVPLEVTIGGVTVDSLLADFDVSVCLEDVTACLLNERILLKQVTLLLNAVPVSAN